MGRGFSCLKAFCLCFFFRCLHMAVWVPAYLGERCSIRGCRPLLNSSVLCLWPEGSWAGPCLGLQMEKVTAWRCWESENGSNWVMRDACPIYRWEWRNGSHRQMHWVRFGHTTSKQHNLLFSLPVSSLDLMLLPPQHCAAWGWGQHHTSHRPAGVCWDWQCPWAGCQRRDPNFYAL